MKLSNLKVGDKFRIVEFPEEGNCELVATARKRLGYTHGEWAYWSSKIGNLFTCDDLEVELITEPFYKPYTDLRPLCGTVLVEKSTGNHHLVLYATEDCIEIFSLGNISTVPNYDVLNYFTHLDGTPCGKC
jgi:hypothetical protein